jgi:hypothetical protein
MRYVNAYEVTLGYAGPEEGGTWYDRGEPLGSIPIPDDSTGKLIAAKAMAVSMLHAALDADFEHRPGKGSTHPDAADLVILVEDHVAEDWPTHKPRYE